jgi:hypothetical protein
MPFVSYMFIQDLAHGTPKVSGHIPGYSGHVPHRAEGSAGTPGAEAAAARTEYILKNSLPQQVAPGYTGHRKIGLTGKGQL